MCFKAVKKNSYSDSIKHIYVLMMSKKNEDCFNHAYMYYKVVKKNS